jgi:3D (Asp-Asp-Asp) domain-containing protein
MYVPATSTQPLAAAAPLAPAEIVGGQSPSAPSLFTSPPGAAAVAHIALRVRSVDLNVLAGHPASVAGFLTSRSAPHGELARRVVRLQALTRRGWRTLATDTAGRRGRFRVRYVPSRIGSRQVRLAVAGVGGERTARRVLGRLDVYRLAGARLSSSSTVESTCYAVSGSTASGEQTRPGIAASDELALGTRIMLSSPELGRRVYRIEDRIGSGSQLDLWDSSESACDAYGRREVTFHVIR